MGEIAVQGFELLETPGGPDSTLGVDGVDGAGVVGGPGNVDQDEAAAGSQETVTLRQERASPPRAEVECRFQTVDAVERTVGEVDAGRPGR
nr:hypothetical protein [Longimycelium tulufanense]